MYRSIEGLIQHFEVLMPNRGFDVPCEEIYAATESPNGELGFYIVGDGSPRAYRARTRPPSYIHFAMFPHMIRGYMLSDVVDYFDRGGVLQISDTAGSDVSWRAMAAVPGLEDAYRQSALHPQESSAAAVAVAELILEGLAAHRRISRGDSGIFARARQERRGKGGASGFPFGMDLE